MQNKLNERDLRYKLFFPIVRLRAQSHINIHILTHCNGESENQAINKKANL